MPIAQGARADDGGCAEEEEGEGRHGRPTQTPSNGKGAAASDVRTYRLQGDMAGIVTSTNCMSMQAENPPLPFTDKWSRVCRLNEAILTFKS